jgi:UDP-N-acetylmuramyl tripeptide synthase
VSALQLKILAARAVGKLARRSGRGGGTSLPGRVLLSLEPHAVGMLARRLPQGAAVISATNGKTTTAAMAAGILQHAGRRLVHNRAGANMDGGVASALLEAARGRGIDGEQGLFEIDELWLDRLTPELAPRALLLGNLFRDQLDRYGELETIADRWAALSARLPAQSSLVLCADDPLLADLAGSSSAAVSFFGIEDPGVALPRLQHAADSKHCRRCGSPYRYRAIYLGHLGDYACPSCGQARPTPDVSAAEIELNGTRSSTFTLRSPVGSTRISLPLPGLYNVYNALGAAALCLALGVALEDVPAGLGSVSPAFGRAETIVVDGVPLQLLLMKNPAGANEVLRTLALEREELDVLALLNDQVADGRDVSWVWDADFELLCSQVRTVTCGGSRAAELALRLKYAGVESSRLQVLPELPRALDAAIAQARTGTGRLYVLPTYTALLALRGELSARGHAGQYWEPAVRSVQESPA